MHSQNALLSMDQFQSLCVTQLDYPSPLIGSLFKHVDKNKLAQVSELGPLQPLPVLQISNERYQVLAGFEYLNVFSKLGFKKIVCQVIGKQSNFRCFALQIQHGLSTVLSSPILQAQLLQSAAASLSLEEALRLMPLLGYKPQEYKFQELQNLLKLDAKVIEALHKGHLTVKNGKLLSSTNVEDQLFLVRLIEMFRPGGSKQQKLIELLVELAKRHQQPMETIVQPWMHLNMAETRENLPQQLQGLLRYLQEQCSPRLTEAQREFKQIIHSIQLPTYAQLQHATSFEDETIELKILFKDINSFLQFEKVLPQIWHKINEATTAQYR